MEENMLRVTTLINASIDKVWFYWNDESSIQLWYHASEDWYCPHATNQLFEGGKFNYKLAAKDESIHFDFKGVYLNIVPNHLIEFLTEDGRKVKVLFEKQEHGVQVTELFEPENTYPFEEQKDTWQNVLHNFKKFIDTLL